MAGQGEDGTGLDPSTPKSRFAPLVDATVDRWVDVSERRGAVVIACALAVAVLGVVAGREVEVDTQLESLMPSDSPSRVELAEASRRYASGSPLYLVVTSEDPDYNRRAAAAVLGAVVAWDEVLWAIDRRDPTFFLDRRLLYVEAASLDRLADEVVDKTSWVECDRIPGCANLDDEPPAPNFDSLMEELRASPDVGSLVQLFGASELPDVGERSGEGIRHEVGDLCTDDGIICVVQAALRGDASDFDYSARIVREAQALMESVAPSNRPSGLRLRVAGRHQTLVGSKDVVSTDLARTASLSLVLVLIVLLAQFRGVRAMLALFLPLAVGAGASAIAVLAMAPRVNITSAATLVVLAGLGIDFGVHLLSKYGAEREHGHAPPLAMKKALRGLLSALLAATLTTGAGFGALSAARFEGFAQMGRLAAVGIAITFIAFLATFPAFVLAMHRLVPERRSMLRVWPTVRFLSGPSKRAATIIVAVGVVVAATGAALLPRVAFEYDLAKLRPPTTKEEHLSYGGALHGTSRSPTLMLADTPQDLEAGAAMLRTLYPDGLAPVEQGPWLVTPRTFIPRDQEARLAAIGRLRDAVEGAERHLDVDARERLDRYRPLLEVTQPITVSSLPGWVHEAFAERDGTFGTIGIVYEGGSVYDARRMELRAKRIADWRRRAPNVRFSSVGALLGEITALVREDSPRVIGLAFLGLLLGTLLFGRSLARTSLVLAPVLVSIAAAVIAMVAFDLRANLYNLVVFPLAFGLGVDGAIYVVWTVARGDMRTRSFADLPVAARAVTGATLTTVAAFGSMIISKNLGLVSLGWLSFATLGATLIANLVWLPAVLTLLPARSAPRRGPGTEGSEPGSP